MIKHVVCFKLKDPNETLLRETQDILMSMESRVEQLRSIEVGVDFLRSERSYDIVLIVCVDDEKALDDYQNHPYHCDVVKEHMHRVRESSVAVDFVMD